MSLHSSHYELITEKTLREFSQGFPRLSQVSNFQVFEESGEVVFGTFDAFLSDILLAHIPPIISYVNIFGRELDVKSTVLRPHTAILVRCLTKKAKFCKIKTGSQFGEGIVVVSNQEGSDLSKKDAWNQLFLVEVNPDDRTCFIQRSIQDELTIIGFVNSEQHLKMLKN